MCRPVSIGPSGTTTSAPLDTFASLADARAFDPPRMLVQKDLDQAFGGGLAKGSANVLWGKPGANKTTECLRIGSIHGALFVETEVRDPNFGMVKRIADNASLDCTKIAPVTVDNPRDAIRAIRSRAWPIVIVDSLQGFDSHGSSGPKFLKATAREIVDASLSVGASLIMVVHATRDGDMSGPQWLAHLVDGVFCLTATHIRVVKNRFGPAPLKVKRLRPRLRLVAS